jgi:hypothetical protein
MDDRSISDTLSWDAVRYCDRLSIKENGRNQAKEDSILGCYPPPPNASDLVMNKPGTVVDRHGIILAWYLPNILPKQRQVS